MYVTMHAKNIIIHIYIYIMHAIWTLVYVSLVDHGNTKVTQHAKKVWSLQSVEVRGLDTIVLQEKKTTSPAGSL